MLGLLFNTLITQKLTFLRSLLLGIVLLMGQHLLGQSILFNSSGGTPDASSLMELRSTEKGFLVPRMQASERLAISSPAQGLLVFQTDGTIGFYFHNGSDWDTLGGSTTTTFISNVTNVANSGIAVIRDIKSSGTDGGDFIKGDWRRRDLNDLDGDSSFVSLDTNAFTLDSGTYVITATSPAVRVDQHQIRLYNTTDDSESAVGTSETSFQAASTSSLKTVVNITSKSTFVIQHQCQTDRVTVGMGEGVSWGSCVFTQVQIEKL